MRNGSGPRLSVCMATFNGERWVAAQLRSILDQLEPNDEVVVSDDGSTDRTVEVIRALGDHRIRLLASTAFRSPVRNFENALRNATGEVLALSDQDDLWLDGRAATIRQRFAAPPSPVHLIALDAVVTDAAGAVLHPSLFRRIGAGPGLLKNIYDNTYVGCCLAFSRQLLDIALPFPRGIPMHDMWLGLLAEIFGTVEFVAGSFLSYRRHSANATDFRRWFMPIIQIRRRANLAWNLAARSFRPRHARHATGR